MDDAVTAPFRRSRADTEESSWAAVWAEEAVAEWNEPSDTDPSSPHPFLDRVQAQPLIRDDARVDLATADRQADPIFEEPFAELARKRARSAARGDLPAEALDLRRRETGDLGERAPDERRCVPNRACGR